MGPATRCQISRHQGTYTQWMVCSSAGEGATASPPPPAPRWATRAAGSPPTPWLPGGGTTSAGTQVMASSFSAARTMMPTNHRSCYLQHLQTLHWVLHCHIIPRKVQVDSFCKLDLEAILVLHTKSLTLVRGDGGGKLCPLAVFRFKSYIEGSRVGDFSFIQDWHKPWSKVTF